MHTLPSIAGAAHKLPAMALPYSFSDAIDVQGAYSREVEGRNGEYKALEGSVFDSAVQANIVSICSNERHRNLTSRLPVSSLAVAQHTAPPRT